MELGSANEQDARVERLWKTLEGSNKGYLDAAALRKGLRKIDHPLKNADSLLEDVIKAVDTNRDGRIQFNEFRSFINHTDKALWQLFKSIDHDGNGKLDKNELRSAFAGAGVAIPSTKLDEFFSRIDTNCDGVITFDEWRDFLLFIPAEVPNLSAVFSYYSSSVKINPEGDVQIGDETIEGIGYFLAGGLAGIVSRTSTAPLDRLKVYLIAQTGVAKDAVQAAKSGSPAKAVGAGTRTLALAMKELWAAGGMRSLFAGNGLNVVKVMPESAIKFGFYEGTKRVCARLEGKSDAAHISDWSKFFAGGISGMASQFAVYPLDTLKFRMQCETVAGGLHGNRLIFATARKMWQTNGVLAFYRGLPMGLFGMFPYAAIDLGTFEYLKKTVTARNARKRGCHEADAKPGPFMTAFMGGFAGALGASMVYPLNLVRTRLQSQGTVLHRRTYSGIMDVFRITMQEEGVRGLYKGLTPNLLKVVPAMSITYVVYENSKKLLGLH